MRVNRFFLVGLAITLLSPLLGLIYSLVKINKSNFNSMVINVFLFVFFLTLNLHPYQDLYRRYIETYYSYTDQTTLSQAVSGHVDFTFYLLSFCARKIGLPFPFLVSFLSATSVFLFIKSILSGVRENSNTHTIRLIVILGILVYPTIQLALGMRWGFAISIIIYGYFCHYNKGRFLTGSAIIFLSILTHFSMLIFVPVLVASKFFKVSRFSFVLLSLASSFFSAVFLPLLLSKLGSIGAYASIGYGSDNDINAVGNLNSIIATGVGFLYTAYFTILIMLRWKSVDDINYLKARNVILLLFVFTCLSSISLVAFRRYTNTLFYLFAVCTFFHYCLITNKIKKLVVYICLLSFVFSGVFLQRRPLQLSEIWKGFYTPAIFYVLLSTESYNKYLMDIDDDGDWKGNKINR